MLRKLLTACAVVLVVGIGVKAADNYAATQGSGKTFRCVEITGAICIPSFILSDSTGQLLGSAASPVGVTVSNANANGQATMANSSPVVIASNQSAIPVTGTFFQATQPVSGTVAVSGTTTVATGAADPCQANAGVWTPISITTNTTTKIVTGTSAKKLYICYLYLQTVAANNIAVISGTTGGTCGSNTAGLIGGTTATNGLNNAANSGQAVGSGGFAVAAVTTNNDDICLITSASTPLAGVIKTVVQ